MSSNAFKKIDAEYNAREERLDEARATLRKFNYEMALRRFDFWFEALDDGVAYRNAKDQLAKLRAEQAIVDPDGSLWLSIMPVRTVCGPQPPMPVVNPDEAPELDENFFKNAVLTRPGDDLIKGS